MQELRAATTARRRRCVEHGDLVAKPRQVGRQVTECRLAATERPLIRSFRCVIELLRIEKSDAHGCKPAALRFNRPYKRRYSSTLYFSPRKWINSGPCLPADLGHSRVQGIASARDRHCR